MHKRRNAHCTTRACNLPIKVPDSRARRQHSRHSALCCLDAPLSATHEVVPGAPTLCAGDTQVQGFECKTTHILKILSSRFRKTLSTATLGRLARPGFSSETPAHRLRCSRCALLTQVLSCLLLARPPARRITCKQNPFALRDDKDGISHCLSVHAALLQVSQHSFNNTTTPVLLKQHSGLQLKDWADEDRQFVV